MNTEKLNQAVSQAQQTQASQPQATPINSVPKNRKTRTQTTEQAQQTAKQVVEDVSSLDHQIEMLTLKNAAMNGLSLGQKEAAVFLASKEQTFKASVNAYLVGTTKQNTNSGNEINTKEILKLVGLDVDAFNENLGEQVKEVERNLLPSTRPYLMLSSAD